MSGHTAVRSAAVAERGHTAPQSSQSTRGGVTDVGYKLHGIGTGRVPIKHKLAHCTLQSRPNARLDQVIVWVGPHLWDSDTRNMDGRVGLKLQEVALSRSYVPNPPNLPSGRSESSASQPRLASRVIPSNPTRPARSHLCLGLQAQSCDGGKIMKGDRGS